MISSIIASLLLIKKSPYCCFLLPGILDINEITHTLLEYTDEIQ